MKKKNFTEGKILSIIKQYCSRSGNIRSLSGEWHRSPTLLFKRSNTQLNMPVLLTVENLHRVYY